MSRIRSIKPAFFKSTSVANLSKPARLTWAGLWTYLDDYGYGRDDPRLVKAEIWPLDDDYTARKVEEDLKAIATEGMICRYEHGGRRYIHAPAWLKHQRVNRPQKSLMPPCPLHGDAAHHHGTFTDDSVTPHAESRNGHGRIKYGSGIGVMDDGTGMMEQGNYSGQSSIPANPENGCGKPDDDRNPEIVAMANQLGALDLEYRIKAQTRKLDLDVIADEDAWFAKAVDRRYRQLTHQPAEPDECPTCYGTRRDIDQSGTARPCPDCTKGGST